MCQFFASVLLKQNNELTGSFVFNFFNSYKVIDKLVNRIFTVWSIKE